MDMDGKTDMSMLGIFDGIADQICNYLPDASGIPI